MREVRHSSMDIRRIGIGTVGQPLGADPKQSRGVLQRKSGHTSKDGRHHMRSLLVVRH